MLRSNRVCQGCGTMDDLTVHHIVPRKVRVDDTPSNLAHLCIDCHALVERYYWRIMSLNNTHAATLFKEACRVFWKGRKPTKRQRQIAMDTQAAIWPMLLETITDWRALYDEGLVWAATVKPVRRVDPGAAIMSEPWWVQR